MADIGIYTSSVTLEHKLGQQTDGKGLEATWNMGRFPKELGTSKVPNRIFFAVEGYWRGYFVLSDEVLYNPQDEKKPYSLIFDVTTWTEIDPVPVAKFRGFRYLEDIPQMELAHKSVDRG